MAASWVQLATRIPKPLHRELTLHSVSVSRSVRDVMNEGARRDARSAAHDPTLRARRGGSTGRSSRDRRAVAARGGGHPGSTPGAASVRRGVGRVRRLAPRVERGRAIPRSASSWDGAASRKPVARRSSPEVEARAAGSPGVQPSTRVVRIRRPRSCPRGTPACRTPVRPAPRARSRTTPAWTSPRSPA
jgi:hypothetical protein